MLDRAYLQSHFEDLFDQRIAMQSQPFLTRKQLKTHDIRVLDALTFLQRFPFADESNDTSISDLYLRLSLSPDGRIWLTELTVTEFEWTEPSLSDWLPVLLYAGELAIAQANLHPECLILPLWQSGLEAYQHLALALSQRFQYKLDQLGGEGVSQTLQINWLTYLGKSAQIDHINTLQNIIQSEDADPAFKAVAALSGLLLGIKTDELMIANNLIKYELLNEEYLCLLFCYASEKNQLKLLNILAENPDYNQIVVSALAGTGNHKFIPFLSQFLCVENLRSSVVKSLFILLGDRFTKFLSYEFLVDGSDEVWERVNIEQLINTIQEQYQIGLDNGLFPSGMLAGRSICEPMLNNILAKGFNFHRDVASHKVAIIHPDKPLVEVNGLWGGQ